jgi:hypothetical protein
MNKKVMKVINDFNELCDFKIVDQKNRTLMIKDLQLETQFDISILEWLERIYDYYNVELPSRQEISLNFDNYDHEFMVFYYKTLLEIIEAVEKERKLNA